MGEIKKVGDVYYIEFVARGLMYSQPAGKTEEGAKRKLAEVEGKIAHGEALTIVREIELSLFYERFQQYAKDKYSSKSLERFNAAWSHWCSFLKKSYPKVTQLSQITPAVVEGYKMAYIKTAKPKKLNLTLLLLREIFEYGIRIGFINDNPSLHIALIALPSRHIVDNERSRVAKDLLGRGISLEKIYTILKLNDIAKVMYWANFMPLKRDIY